MDLNRALPEMIPALARELGESGRLRVAPSVGPLQVEANVTLLKRALIHLVQNAREASASDQSVRLSWGPAPDGVGEELSWEGVRIRVEDQGEGIPRRNLPWLFEPFFSTRSGGHPLQGMGLSVVQAIVEGHGGWVEVRSREGIGTEVDLFLPLPVPEEGQEPKEMPGKAEVEEPTSGTPRVLVLEDDPLLARLVSQILSRSGYEVETCATAQEADRHWRRTGRTIDLAIVSRTLSGGRSGVDIGQEWQGHTPDLPVLVIDRQPLAQPDVNAVVGFPLLVPPFEPGEIVCRVRELLEAAPDGQPEELPSTGGSWLTH